MENNLEIDVKNAKELGLSYGYYKALTYNPDSTPIKQSKENKRLSSHERYHSKVKFLKKEGE